MKKYFTLVAVLGFGISLSAQKTTKIAKLNKAKTSKSVAVVAAPKMDVVATKTDDKEDHTGHNHAAPQVTAQVQPALVDINKPVAEENMTLSETSYDFGKIPQGKPVTHDFKFTNTGKTDLVLENVVAGCGCTTPSFTKGTYKPGQTSIINIGFNAGGVGPAQKSVTVTYNGGLTKAITFTADVFAAPATPAPENKGVQMLKGQ
jgi:hypothetical protein